MAAKKKAYESNLRFTVVVEFLAGVFGLFGVGRLLKGRIKEARVLLIASLVLILVLGLVVSTFASGVEEMWLPYVIRVPLALISALQLNYVLARKERIAKMQTSSPTKKRQQERPTASPTAK